MKNTRQRSSSSGKTTIIAAVAVVLVVGAAVGYKFMSADALYKDIPVVGHVDGKPVYLVEAEQIVSAIIPPKDGKKVAYSDLDENSKMMIIREVAAQRVMLKEAEEQGFVEDAALKRKVLEYKNKLIRDQLLAKIANAEITEAKLLAQYQEIEKSVKGKTQVKLSHILLDSEADAKKAEEALKKDSFAKVAKELSRDSSTKERGGELGYMLSGSMDENIEKAALSMKVDDVSSPVKTKFGWHLIRLEEKKIATLPSFEDLKPRIAQDLYTAALKEHADKALADVKIEVEKTVAEKTPETSSKNAVTNNDLPEVEPSSDKPASAASEQKK